MSIQHLVNEYQPRTHDTKLGEDVRVIYIESSYQKTMDKVKELLCLLKGALKIQPLPKGSKSAIPFDFDFDPASIVANLKSQEVKDLEDFIKSNCRILINHNDEWLNVDVSKTQEFEYVFNVNPEQAFPFLIEGVKFHFLKYSASILESFISQAKTAGNQQINQSLLDSLKTG